MFKNLLETDSGISCFVNYIDDPQLCEQLARLGVARDAEIVKLPAIANTDAVVFNYPEGTFNLSKKQAESILVRACEICWSCGECGTESD